MIAFIQNLALYSHNQGGSVKIFRSLLDRDHPAVLSIDTNPSSAPGTSKANEVHLASRPGFGRLEYTRLQGALGLLDRLFSPRFEQQLRRVLTDHKVKLIHLFANAYTVVPVYKVATELNIPYFLSVHDDLEYLSRGHALRRQMIAGMGRAWREAKGVFAVSDELGQEYSRRYGARKFWFVTEGLRCVAEASAQRPEKSLRIYFMGLFHLNYSDNLRALLDGLKIVRSRHPDWDISVTCRCGAISAPVYPDDVPINVLPFAPETDVKRDMLSADILYQPMPFQEYARAFNRFSLSVKMINYMGSGLPIFYHGPEESAACKLLKRHNAAEICATLDPDAIAGRLLEAIANRTSIAENALALARSQFMLDDHQRRFWEPILAAL
jgi:hypothetical protein